MNRRPSLRLTLAFVLALVAHAAPCRPLHAQGQQPPWRDHLMPWPTHAGEARPWRDDTRLAGKAADGFPDDFPVAFLNPDSAHTGRFEVMWVRVIAYDAPTDQLLGILLNQPDFVRTTRENDNVVFRIDAGAPFPNAVGPADYGAPGWPASNAGALADSLREGIRAYRAGNYGHNMPGIERCIAVLTPAVEQIPATARVDERFVAHFLLGRCLAEQYETRRAIDQFRAAVAVDSTDLDAHMALLAELSVITHRRADQPRTADDARWDDQFVAELALIRRRFPSDKDVAQLLGFVFDPANATKFDSLPPAERARLSRVGYAFFRWKQR